MSNTTTTRPVRRDAIDFAPHGLHDHRRAHVPFVVANVASCDLPVDNYMLAHNAARDRYRVAPTAPDAYAVAITALALAALTHDARYADAALDFAPTAAILRLAGVHVSPRTIPDADAATVYRMGDVVVPADLPNLIDANAWGWEGQMNADKGVVIGHRGTWGLTLLLGSDDDGTPRTCVVATVNVIPYAVAATAAADYAATLDP